MKLLGVKPTAVKRRLKLMLFGEAGTGKTTAAISFPGVYLIDADDSSSIPQYAQLLESGGGVLVKTTDYDELLGQVEALTHMEHSYKTLVIDPITIIWNSTVEKSEEKLGHAFGRGSADAKKKFKILVNRLLNLDMNVVMIAQSKTNYSTNMTIIEKTFDGFKELDYLFDLVLEVQKHGNRRVAIVKKSRFQVFEDMGSFDLSYDVLADNFGRAILERDTIREKNVFTDIEDAKSMDELQKAFTKAWNIYKNVPELSEKLLKLKDTKKEFLEANTEKGVQNVESK